MTLPAAVALGGIAFNTIGKAPVLKIHPAIGVARVGDSPSAFFIGPELPLSPSTGQADGVGSVVPPFRDGGKIKRQAARFRIFHYPAGAVDAEELNLDHPEVAEIEWKVHLANRKAAFFRFEGQVGATGPFLSAPPKRRNESIVDATARAAKLVIDPQGRSIKGALAGPVAFDTGKGNWPRDLSGAPLIDYLGELRTDAKGRLLVLGGRGVSKSSNALPPSLEQMNELKVGGYAGPAVSAARPPAPLLEYANNDTWFDDVSDGPVTATVKLKSGRIVAVQFPGWVMVGPPDFAPEVRNVVSMYDTMLDVAARTLPDPVPPFYTPFELADLKDLKASLGGGAAYQPEWFFDIEPILQAGFQARFVHAPVSSSHMTLNIAQLQSSAPAEKPLRELVFNFLRKPAGNISYLHGDPGSMPKLLGDKYFNSGDPKRVLALRDTQYRILELWKDGHFLVGAGGPPSKITPSGLDRAALESCVGGAFFPGIEASWLVRDVRAYSEPFRIRHGAAVGPLTVGPGFFSQQMAQPWQADFMDCAKDNSLTPDTTIYFGWWPAQRPDDVYLSAADASAGGPMKAWARGLESPVASPPAGFEHARMVNLWSQLGFVVASGPVGAKVFVETERTLP
jgi:hypothetical protein